MGRWTGARTSKTCGVQHTEPGGPQTQSSHAQAEGKQYRLKRTGHPFPFTCLSPPGGARQVPSLTPQTEMTYTSSALFRGPGTGSPRLRPAPRLLAICALSFRKRESVKGLGLLEAPGRLSKMRRGRGFGTAGRPKGHSAKLGSTFAFRSTSNKDLKDIGEMR